VSDRSLCGAGSIAWTMGSWQLRHASSVTRAFGGVIRIGSGKPPVVK
jgi:hypothetical protein